MQTSVSMVGMGMASSHLLVLSMMLNRYWNPSLEVVRGPTKSTWMWEKRCDGTGMGLTAAGGWPVTLALLHAWQSLTQVAMSLFMKGHTTLAPITLPVAFMPGWPRLWKAWKTWRWWVAGMRGQGLGPLVSESSSTLLKRTGRRVVLASLAALVSPQLRCEAAIAAKSSCAAESATALTSLVGGRERVSATTLSALLMCLMLLVNSAT